MNPFKYEEACSFCESIWIPTAETKNYFVCQVCDEKHLILEEKEQE